jgi:hypothetical protein
LKELLTRTLRYDTTVIDGALAQYCAGARNRFEQCSDFASTRQFLLDYVEKIVLSHDDITITGRITLGIGEQSLPFRIKTAITREDRRTDRLRGWTKRGSGNCSPSLLKVPPLRPPNSFLLSSS